AKFCPYAAYPRPKLPCHGHLANGQLTSGGHSVRSLEPSALPHTDFARRVSPYPTIYPYLRRSMFWQPARSIVYFLLTAPKLECRTGRSQALCPIPQPLAWVKQQAWLLRFSEFANQRLCGEGFLLLAHF